MNLLKAASQEACRHGTSAHGTAGAVQSKRSGVPEPVRGLSAQMTDIGRWLLGIGLLLAALGALFLVIGRFVPGGRLPGDVSWQRGNVKVFAPLGTMLLLSLLLTIILNLITRWRK
jgi:Protein of unknown function (DUF2905)